MKLLILFAVIALCSCNNDSSQTKIYRDSVNYYSTQLDNLTDSGFSLNDSMRARQQNRIIIYKAKREYFMEKLKSN